MSFYANFYSSYNAGSADKTMIQKSQEQLVAIDGIPDLPKLP